MFLENIGLGSYLFRPKLDDTAKDFEEQLKDFYTSLESTSIHKDILTTFKQQINLHKKQLINEFELEKKKEQINQLNKNKIRSYEKMYEPYTKALLNKIQTLEDQYVKKVSIYLNIDQSIKYLIDNPECISRFLQNNVEDKYDSYDDSFTALELNISIEDIDIEYIVNKDILYKNQQILNECYDMCNNLKKNISFTILPIKLINKFVNEAELEIDNLLKELIK
jgi:hypothetical protein